MAAAVHYIGRCKAKGCTTTLRLTATERRSIGHNRYGAQLTQAAFVLPGLRAKPDGRGGWLNPAEHGWDIESRTYTLGEAHDHGALPMCLEHRRNLRWTRVDGRHNDEVRCDARCEGAKGPSCECSCGGANHGGRWAA